MSDKIKELQQLIFYEKILKKIINIVNGTNNKDENEEISNPKIKLNCNQTDYYHNIFSEIKTACLINDDETFQFKDLEIKPNKLKELVENSVLDISRNK